MQASARYAAGTWAEAFSRMPARRAQGEHRHSINSAPDRRASVPFTPPFHTAAIPQPSTIPVQLSQLAPCQMPSSPHWTQSNARPQRIASMMDAIGPLTGPVGERSRTVHAYRVNTLAGEVFTRVNTSSWQVFTHLPLNPKKSLCGTRLAVWRTRSVPTDSRQSSNSRSDNSSVSASYSSVEDLCAYLNTSGMLRRMWFFRWKACRPYHTICGWTDNSQAKAGRGVDTIMLRHLHCRRHQFICKPSQV